MTSSSSPLHIDAPSDSGLVPTGSRFALARPLFDFPNTQSAPDMAPQPFGMRFFRPAGEVRDMAPVPYRYCATRQLAITDDDTETPLISLPIAWERTTTGMTDGKTPGVEEFTMDYCGDR
jgi:putative ATP-grasp target RiPP